MEGRTIKKYCKIWWVLTSRTAQIAFNSRFGASIFIIGKLIRFFSFLALLFVILSKTKFIAGYDSWQVIFFYATFNLIDTLPQIFMREVYRFRWQVVNGYFDHILIKPFSPLFKTLFGGADLLDISILFLSLVLLFIAGNHIHTASFWQILLYGALIGNALLIAIALHVLVLAVGILTTEVDNAIMLYRDLTQMGRMPVDIYKEPMRGLITFVIPVGIMMTFPPKVLMGLLSPFLIVLAFCIGMLLFIISLRIWDFALLRYSSASS